MYLNEEIPNSENLHNKKNSQLNPSSSQKKIKTIYKFKTNIQNTYNKTMQKSVSVQSFINKSENKKVTDFKNLHSFIDDLQLNFDNSMSRENEELEKLKANNRYSVDKDTNYNSTYKNSLYDKKLKTVEEDEYLPLVHEQNMKNMMSLYPETLSRSFEFELFKKYLGRVKQEKYIENKRNNCQNNVNNNGNFKQKFENNFKKTFTKKNKESIINVASKLPSFSKNLNKELGRFSNCYGKIQSLDRFNIGNKILQIYDEQDNVIAYRSKKINLEHSDKKIKLKPLITKNNHSIEKLANNMFNYSKRIQKRDHDEN